MSTRVLITVISVIGMPHPGDLAVNQTDVALPLWSLWSAGDTGSKQAIDAQQDWSVRGDSRCDSFPGALWAARSWG